MKIIATTKNGYVVEIEAYEMARLTGVREDVRDGYGGFLHSHSQGKTVEIHDAWKALNAILASHKNIVENAQALRGFAVALEAVAGLVKRTQELTPEPPPVTEGAK